MKKLKVICLLFISVFLLVSCGNKKSTEINNKDGLTQISIQIDGAATPYYTPLYTAKEKGWFKEEGLDVTFYYTSAAEIVKNVAVENVAFGFPNADPVFLAKANKVPVKVIHSTYQEGLGAVIFKKSSNIRTPKDLKGKTIAITSYGSPNYIQLQVILKKNGLDIKDVNIKIIGTGAIVNSLVSDQVDAICFSTLRTYDLKAQGIDVSEFRSENYMTTQGNVLITSDKFLKENPKVCKAFIRALNKSLDYLINKDGLSNGISLAINKYAPGAKGKEKKFESIIKQEFIPRLWQSKYTKKYGFGYSSFTRYEKSIDTLKEFGLIENSYFPKDLAVNLNMEERK